MGEALLGVCLVWSAECRVLVIFGSLVLRYIAILHTLVNSFFLVLYCVLYA